MTSLSKIKGLGEARQKALESAGITCAEGLLERLPDSYLDMTNTRPLSDIRAGEAASLHVFVTGPASSRYTGKLSVVRAWVTDGTDRLRAVWFNQPWLAKELHDGKELYLYARAAMQEGRMVLQSPVICEGSGIYPQYRSVPGIPPKTYRRLVEAALETVEAPFEDVLPEAILARYELMHRDEAIRISHMPPNRESLIAAQRSLSFEEMLLYQTAAYLSRVTTKKGISIPCKAQEEAEFWKTMSFPPTNAQKRTLSEIAKDMASEKAMARLVQGDVGSGKTAVAFGALYMAAKAGFQGALMAPTEVLAAQHYEGARALFEPMGITVGLLTGSLTAKQHKIAHAAIAEGSWQIVIGTHALITEGVEYKNLGLVITDEQHRFGVRQRTVLSDKGNGTNVLVMSATPIPRTMALILYGDLDVSVIDEMPPGRTPVKTRIVPEGKREGMYGFLKNEVAQGRQVYVVCPLVEESEAVDAQAAQEMYASLKDDKLRELRVAMVHGRMKASEKDKLLEEFRKGDIDVLVSTTVIEVGVNVPNATVMVIEDAYRFGLAQLHQLRGRVGRGSLESWCFLMGEGNSRLRLLTQTNDGFKIAEQDMRTRGSGDLFGFRQTGTAGSGLLTGEEDAILLKETHDAAIDITAHPDIPENAQVIEQATKIMTEKLAAAGMN